MSWLPALQSFAGSPLGQIGTSLASDAFNAIIGRSKFPSEHKRDELRRDQEQLTKNTTRWQSQFAAGKGMVNAIKGQRRLDKYTDERDASSFQRFRSAAENAGINVLTAMGGGGAFPGAGGGFASTIGDGPQLTSPATISGPQSAGANTFDTIAKWASGEMQAELNEARKESDLHKIRDDQEIRGKSGEAIRRTQDETEHPLGSKENPIQLYIWGHDPRTGKEGWIINPELGDIEQLPVAIGAAEIWADVEGETRPLTREQWEALRTEEITTTELPKWRDEDYVPTHDAPLGTITPGKDGYEWVMTKKGWRERKARK